MPAGAGLLAKREVICAHESASRLSLWGSTGGELTSPPVAVPHQRCGSGSDRRYWLTPPTTNSVPSHPLRYALSNCYHNFAFRLPFSMTPPRGRRRARSGPNRTAATRGNNPHSPGGQPAKNPVEAPARSSRGWGRAPRAKVTDALTPMAATLIELGGMTSGASSGGSVKNISTITRT